MRLMWRKKDDVRNGENPVQWKRRQRMAKYASDARKADDAPKEERTPIARLANTIIQAAIKERASDIYIEPDKRNTRIRYRVDGVLHEVMVVPDYLHAPLITQVREMTGLPSESSDNPQSGLITFQFLENDYRLRVDILPTQYGEKIVLHICNQASAMLGLSKLGVTPETQGMFEETLIQSGGMIVFAGHTGSGRTTTQSNALSRMNSIERTSFVIGERLEYELDGVSFVQVGPKAGLTYEEAIAAVRYESPGIVMLDQILDVNVWRAALDLTHSGTIVMASVCANDSVAALIRLRDFGISSSVLASSISGVLAQKLVRRPCRHCQKIEPADPKILSQFVKLSHETEMVNVVKAVGCEHCRQTGYIGRIGIFEYLPQTDETAQALLNLSGVPLKNALYSPRFQTFQGDIALKILEGRTTLEEAQRVFHGDRIV